MGKCQASFRDKIGQEVRVGDFVIVGGAWRGLAICTVKHITPKTVVLEHPNPGPRAQDIKVVHRGVLSLNKLKEELTMAKLDNIL
jgi:hypothetical protein